MTEFENGNLDAIFFELEGQWLKPLLRFVEELFIGARLPSHDQLHHFRVWHFAKELLISFKQKNKAEFSKDFIEGLMISSLLHDVGLTETLAEEHGEQSAKLAKSFLTNDLDGNRHKQEMFEAIISHDDKSYGQVDSRQTPGIYHFLTVADDLDALGVLGLIRYIEIYTHRKISTDYLQERIRMNMESRFKFIESFISFNEVLLQKHYTRYKKALNYLDQLDTQALEELVRRLHRSDLTIKEQDVNSLKLLLMEYKSEVLQIQY